MGTKPVHVFVGLALVGLLASGCRNGSAGGYASGSGSMTTSTGAYQPRSVASARNTAGGSFSAGATTAGTTGAQGMPGGSSFSAGATGGMTTSTAPMPGGMQSSMPTQGYMTGSAGMTMQGGTVSHAGPGMPTANAMDDTGMRSGGVTVAPQTQGSFGATQSYTTPAMAPLTPGANQ